MSENSLVGLFFPAVAGLFFFMKKTYSDDMYKTDVETRVVLHENDGRSGVTRYLEKQQNVIAPQVEQDECIALTGVAKYLQDQDKHPMTRVAKYALRVELADRQAKLNQSRIVETGVGKYLKNQVAAPKTTGVAKYLKRQESIPKASKVAKYITRKTFEEKLLVNSQIIIKETGVSKYLKSQEELPKVSSVTKYLTRQALLAKQTKVASGEKIITGVAKYLQQQESLPKASSVAKYIKKQAAESEIKAEIRVETSVDKYLRSCS